MLNAEKFKEEIEAYDYNFAVVNNKVVSCDARLCYECELNHCCSRNVKKWLLSEYEPSKIEPAVYNLKCDDKVEVSDDGITWLRRHFKGIKGNLVVVWAYGMTSFSTRTENDVAKWEYARIPRWEM